MGLLVLALLLPDEALARGRGGSFGSRSSSSRSSSWGRSRSSSSRSTSTRSSSWGSSSRSSSRPSSSSSWGSRPATTTSRPAASATVSRPPRASAADVAAHRKAVQANSFGRQEGHFSSPVQARTEAIEDFSKKYSSQYPTTFKEKPGTRPEYIPDAVETAGKQAKVEYHVENNVGGYYYLNSAGHWILYNLAADAARRDRYMYRHGYDPSGQVYVDHSHGHRSRSGGGWGWILFALVLILILGGIVFYYYVGPGATLSPPVRKKERRSEPDPPEKPTMTPPPPPNRTTLDTTRVDYWQAIRPGDIVTLKDRETLELLMEEKRPNFARGLDLTVKIVRRITEQRELMHWVLCEFEQVHLQGEDQTWYLLVKVVDEAFDLRVLFVPADFQPGSRAELLDAGARWLFKPPADENNFRPGELEWTEEIDQTLDDGQTLLYRQKPQGLLFGTLVEEPKPSGLKEPQFVSILEYQANRDCENPELVLLEIGGVELADYSQVHSEAEARAAQWAAERASAGGGYVLLLQGANASTQDLELMQV
jgi:hypothetical protein